MCISWRHKEFLAEGILNALLQSYGEAQLVLKSRTAVMGASYLERVEGRTECVNIGALKDGSATVWFSCVSRGT